MWCCFGMVTSKSIDAPPGQSGELSFQDTDNPHLYDADARAAARGAHVPIIILWNSEKRTRAITTLKSGRPPESGRLLASDRWRPLGGDVGWRYPGAGKAVGAWRAVRRF